ncbi:TIGR02594 family protein [Neisseria bergeri]|uniref:TIGR02594 family protein n=1 Tax=Neisseria bergeri TaxID=1906581 RepID=UPI00272C139E|nr:TIGR02594 family protein [Neisseria bergeri]
MQELKWIEEARKYLGTHEKVNGKSNPVLLAMLQEMGNFSQEQKAWWKETDTPWCGLFVGYCLGKADRFVVPQWYRAGAWADERYLTRLSKPAYGCLAVKKRTGGNHVFFIVGKDKQGRLMGFGGNQGNRVSIIPFNADELSFWWPSYWRDKQCVKSEPAAVRYELPLVDATGKQGESEA